MRTTAKNTTSAYKMPRDKLPRSPILDFYLQLKGNYGFVQMMSFFAAVLKTNMPKQKLNFALLLTEMFLNTARSRL